MLAAHLPKCRMCACPLMEGGVYLPEVNASKLSKWWRSETGRRIDNNWIRNSWACVFCVRRAKLSLELKGNREDAWWPSDIQDPLYNHYKSGWLKACSVQLRKLTDEEITNYSYPIKIETLDIKEELEDVAEAHNFEFVDSGSTFPASNPIDSCSSSNCDDRSIRRPTFVCDTCGKCFNMKLRLKVHIKKMHINREITQGVLKAPKDPPQCTIENPAVLQCPQDANTTGVQTDTLLQSTTPLNKRVLCRACKHSFVDQTVYTQHQVGAQECYLCGNLIENFCKLLCHVAEKHCQNVKIIDQDNPFDSFKWVKIYVCTFCDFKVQLEKSLATHYSLKHKPYFHHMRTQASGKSLSILQKSICDSCRMHVTSAAWTSHKDNCYCSICQEPFGCNTLLYFHSLEPTFRCFECKTQFCQTAALDEHLIQAHQLPSQPMKKLSFGCTKCFENGVGVEVFETRHELQLHTLHNHTTSLKIRACNFCGLVLANSDEMMRHVFNKHNSKKLCCHECKLLFDDNTLLRLHIFIKHNKPHPTILQSKPGTSSATNSKESESGTDDFEEVRSQGDYRDNMRIGTDVQKIQYRANTRKKAMNGRVLVHKEVHPNFLPDTHFNIIELDHNYARPFLFK